MKVFGKTIKQFLIDGRISVELSIMKASSSLFVCLLFWNANLFAQTDKFAVFNTDSTKNSKYLYEGLVISENLYTKKYGYIDTIGNLVIPYLFDEASIFKEGIAGVRVEDKFGYIDKSGKLIIPAKYDAISYFINGLAIVYKDNKAGVIDSVGKVVLPFNFRLLSSGNHKRFINKRSGNKFGLVSVDGKTILDNKYSMIAHLNNTFYLAEEGEKWQFFDSLGALVFNEFYEEAYIFRKEQIIKLKKNGKFGMVNKNGQLIVPLQYEAVKNATEGLFAVKQKNKWGFINEKNEVKIPFTYDLAQPFNKGRARVKIGGNFNFIDKQNKLLLPKGFEQLNPILFTDLYFIGNRDSLRIYDGNLKVVNADYFQSIGSAYYNKILFKKDNRFGYLNANGKVVIPNIFEKAGSFMNGYAMVTKDKKEGFIDTLGNELLPIIYDDIDRVRAEQRILEKDGKFGIANKAKIVVPVKYNYLKGTQFDRYITRDKEKFGLINLNNEIILENKYDEIIDANYGHGCKIRKGKSWGFIQKRYEQNKCANNI